MRLYYRVPRWEGEAKNPRQKYTRGKLEPCSIQAIFKVKCIYA